MDDVVGMWILETTGDVRNLRGGSARRRYGLTRKRELVQIFAVSNVCHQISAWHPTGNDSEGIGGYAQNRDDVWMRQVFRHYGHPVEDLQDS